MVERFGWRMVKFTGLDGPAFCDLAHVAACRAMKEPGGAKDMWELEITIGTAIYLTGGQSFYVRDSVDTVFGEIHRYRTEQEPPAPSFKHPQAAPAGDVEAVTDTPAAPGEESRGNA